MEVVLSWKLLFRTRAWHLIRFSTQAPLHALFIPVLIGLGSYKNVLAIWGHSWWKLTLTQIVSLRAFPFCFERHLEFSRALPLYTWSQTSVPGSPFPAPCSLLPVPCSPFPVLVTSRWTAHATTTRVNLNLGLQACHNKFPVDVILCVPLAVSCVRVNLPEFRRYFYCLIF